MFPIVDSLIIEFCIIELLPIFEFNISSKFSGDVFVITGSFKSYSRLQIKELLEQKGAKVTNSISSKTNFLIVGENAGSKLEKARKNNIKIIFLSRNNFVLRLLSQSMADQSNIWNLDKGEEDINKLKNFKNENNFHQSRGDLGLTTEKQSSTLEELVKYTKKVESPLQRMENNLHHFVTFVILPLFAISNSGVIIDSSINNIFNNSLAILI